MDIDRYKFGEYIYTKRKKLGLTQDELGRKLGVTNKAVSKWEVGETLPDVTMLISLAGILGVTVDELLTQKDKVVENEVVVNVKVNKVYIAICFILGLLLLISIIGIISLNSYYKTKTKNLLDVKTIDVKVDSDNILSLIDVNPKSDIVCDGATLKIDSSYKLKNEYSFKDKVDLLFTVVYQFNYYYYLQDGTMGVVTYYNRFCDIIMNTDNNIVTESILLEPKMNINDFKGFKKIEIDFIIINTSGTIVKTETNK